MALTTVSFTIDFDYSASPKVFKLTDTTDYAGQSVSTSDANGIFTITGPAGTVYSNTSYASPDIDVDSSTTFNTVNLPLDASGDVLEGSYTFAYSVKDDNTGDIVTQTETITHDFTSPTITLTLEFDAGTPYLKSTDTTSYDVNGVTPTKTYSHVLKYPASTGVADLTGTAQILSTNTVYTQRNVPLQYFSVMTTALVYSFTGYTVTDSVTGTAYALVEVDPNLCDIYCGLHTAYNSMVDAGPGTQKFRSLLEDFNYMMSIAQLASIAIDCGRTQDLASYMSKIRAIGSFTSSCDCADDQPVLITGVGASGNSVVVAAGTRLSVSSSTVGSTTTYTVSLDAATDAILSSIENNTLASTGTGISVASATSGGVKTYTVNSTITEPELMFTLVTLDSNSGSAPTIGVSSKVYGNPAGETLQNPTIALETASAAAWSSYPIGFTVSDFFVSGSATYYPSIEIVTITGAHEDSVKLIPNITSIGSTSFEFNIANPNGSIITGSMYDSAHATDTIKILIKILA